MKRPEQHKLNQQVIERIKAIQQPGRIRIPSYESVINILNAEGFLTSRGSTWTRRSLYRMLQRESVSGLHGLFRG